MRRGLKRAFRLPCGNPTGAHGGAASPMRRGLKRTDPVMKSPCRRWRRRLPDEKGIETSGLEHFGSFARARRRRLPDEKGIETGGEGKLGNYLLHRRRRLPDEKGIETGLGLYFSTPILRGGAASPMRRGLKHLKTARAASRSAGRRRRLPDEKGIETIVMKAYTYVCVIGGAASPMRRGLKRSKICVSAVWISGGAASPMRRGLKHFNNRRRQATQIRRRRLPDEKGIETLWTNRRLHC